MYLLNIKYVNSRIPNVSQYSKKIKEERSVAMFHKTQNGTV